MSRSHPHGFPHDTPEPVAEPYGSIDSLLQLIGVWVKFSLACGGTAALLAFFFPSLFTLFR